MRDLGSELQAHVDGGVTTLCWCWLVKRKDGIHLGFTNHDRDVVFGGNTYEAATGMLATEAQSSLGLSVDNMDVEGAIESDRITEADISTGKYDDAEVDIYIVNWSDNSQRYLFKRGNWGEVTRGKTMFTTEFRGLAARLQQNQGRSYQYTCDVDVGSTKCGIDLTSGVYRGTGTILTSNGRSEITVSGLDTYDSDWFSKGKISFTSGDNNGTAVEIRSHRILNDSVAISLWAPSSFNMEEGDTFEVTVGCDKLGSTCSGKFSNIANFQGFYHMPTNDQILQYATQDDVNLDGGSIFNG